jgi:cold shock CspA family protein
MALGRVLRCYYKNSYGYFTPEDGGENVYFHLDKRIGGTDPKRLPLLNERVTYKLRIIASNHDAPEWAYADDFGGKDLWEAMGPLRNPLRFARKAAKPERRP